MRMMLIVGIVSLVVAQQAPPATEVFLAPLTISGTTLTLGTPMNISNNPGYDNQPSFLPDSSAVLFASNRDTKQNDIYKFDIATKQVVQITKTADNEYSPIVMPDGTAFSSVHGAEQSLMRYNLNGSGRSLAYQHKGLIGYHVWTGPAEIAAFVLGSPNTLQVIDTGTGASTTLDVNIGRSLLRRPGGTTVSYVAKLAARGDVPAVWLIKEFDIKTRRVSVITETVKGSEDLTWLPDGRILMGSGSTLMVWKDAATGWTSAGDVAAAGVTKITRLSASPDGKWLAIVGEPAPKLPGA
jgi:WD40 repeat protein